jgi:hypothetical protein
MLLVFPRESPSVSVEMYELPYYVSVIAEARFYVLLPPIFLLIEGAKNWTQYTSIYTSQLKSIVMQSATNHRGPRVRSFASLRMTSGGGSLRLMYFGCEKLAHSSRNNKYIT